MRITKLLDLGRKHGRFLFPLVVLSSLSAALLAQGPAPRITAAIDNAHRTTIPGTHPPMARQANDTGRVPSGTKLGGISIVFGRTASQEAKLQALISEQQNSSSALYHKWLTPEEFANQFGVTDSDITKIESWLEARGIYGRRHFAQQEPCHLLWYRWTGRSGFRYRTALLHRQWPSALRSVERRKRPGGTLFGGAVGL